MFKKKKKKTKYERVTDTIWHFQGTHLSSNSPLPLQELKKKNIYIYIYIYVGSQIVTQT